MMYVVPVKRVQIQQSHEVKVSERLVFEGIRFNVHEIEIPADDGKTVTRHVARHPGAVVIVPILDHEHVVLIHNTRATVGKQLLELPAGTREIGEEADVTAERELIEETGYHAAKITKVLKFYASPGITDELMHLYIAQGLTAGDHAREAGETIENRITSWSEIETLLESGGFEDGKTIAGLLFAQRWLQKQRENS